MLLILEQNFKYTKKNKVVYIKILKTSIYRFGWFNKIALNKIIRKNQILIDEDTLKFARKIHFSGAPNSVLLKASSRERCVPRNFVHLVALRGTRVRLSCTSSCTKLNMLWKDEAIQ